MDTGAFAQMGVVDTVDSSFYISYFIDVHQSRAARIPDKCARQYNLSMTVIYVNIVERWAWDCDDR